MSRAIFSVTNDCVLNKIPKKGIARANENKLKIVDKTLNTMLSTAHDLYGIMYFSILRKSFINLITVYFAVYYNPV